MRTLSRSRLPKETDHRLSLFDRSVPSVSSGPWYGRILRRLRGGSFGASGGGVGGLRWTVKSNREMIKELCSWTATSFSYTRVSLRTDIPKFGASSAWRTESSNSCLDIRADTN